MIGVAEFRQLVNRLVREQVAPAAEERDAWTACQTVIPRLPQAVRDQMAVEFLAQSYLRALDREADEQPKPEKITSHHRPRRRHKREPVILDAEAQAELDAELAKIDARLWSNLTRLVDDYTTQVKAEWTAELLAQPFMVASGVVTFGEATIEQHREGSLNAQAEGALALERAAQHEAALNDLAASGAACLNDHIQASAA